MIDSIHKENASYQKDLTKYEHERRFLLDKLKKLQAKVDSWEKAFFVNDMDVSASEVSSPLSQAKTSSPLPPLQDQTQLFEEVPTSFLDSSDP